MAWGRLTRGRDGGSSKGASQAERGLEKRSAAGEQPRAQRAAKDGGVAKPAPKPKPKEDPTVKAMGELLNTIDGERLSQIVTLIERTRQRAALEPAIAKIRPKLALLRPPRPMTFERLMVTPLEDFLVPAHAWRPERGEISRDFLPELLATAEKALDGEERGRLEATMRGHMMSEHVVATAVGNTLWPAVSKAVGELAAQAGGATPTARQGALAASLLDAAPSIYPRLDKLPARPMGELTPFQTEQTIEVLEQCEEHSIGRLEAALLWLVARSFKPMTILGLLLNKRVGRGVGDGIVLARKVALAALARQETRVELLEAVELPMLETISELEGIGGTYLSVRDSARDLAIPAPPLDSLAKALRKTLQAKIDVALVEEYEPSIDRLHDPDLPDDEVQVIESTATAIGRAAALGRNCGAAHEIDRRLGATESDVAERLHELYGRDAQAVVLVDQLRAFERVFGGQAARRLWGEIDRRRKSPDWADEPEQAGADSEAWHAAPG